MFQVWEGEKCTQMSDLESRKKERKKEGKKERKKERKSDGRITLKGNV